MLAFSRFLLTAPLLFLFSSFFWSCANIQPPSGGPVDTEAPKVVSMDPPLGTTNFQSTQKIYFTFDEKIEAPNLYQKLLISPITNADFQYEVSTKRLLLFFKDALDSNTTYSLNFRGGVTDITAKNQDSLLDMTA